MPGTARGEQLFASVSGTNQNGGGSIFQYAPGGTLTTFASGLDKPRGLAFDSVGNLFVATNTRDSLGNSQGTIFKFTPDGVMSTFATGFPANFFLNGMATDAAGNVFVAALNPIFPPSATTFYKITPGGTVSTFGSIPGLGIGLAFDSAGNLYAVDGFFPTIYKFTPGGTQSVFVGSAAFTGVQTFSDAVTNSTTTLTSATANFTAQDVGLTIVGTNIPVGTTISTFTNSTTVVLSAAATGTGTGGTIQITRSQGPAGLAFDQFGNLFVSTGGSDGNDAILKFTVNPDGTEGTESVFATGLNNPRGLAFDGAGNLFVAEFAFTTIGDILEFTPGGGAPTVFASGIGKPTFLAFTARAATPVGSNVPVNIGTVGSAVVALTFPQITVAGTTTVTPIDPSFAGTLPSGFELTGGNLAFQITTTATYTTPPPIIIAFQVPSVDAATFSQLRVLHNEGGALVDVTASDPAPNPTTQTIYASVSSLSPFVIAKFTLKAQVQQPINADGTSAFSVKRGVVPVKFTLTQDGAPTCALPPATIALTRTAGGTIGAVNESTYVMPADSGSSFRIDSCQYVYNLNAGGLGVGTYRVDIKISGQVAGSGMFQLK
jgi:sugar lactone lactonase YvrE